MKYYSHIIAEELDNFLLFKDIFKSHPEIGKLRSENITEKRKISYVVTTPTDANEGKG